MAFNIDDLHILNVAGSSYIAANEDIFDGNPSTDIVSMENYHDVYFIITKNAGATGTATITVSSCDDVTPTTATAIAFEYKKMTTIDTMGAWTAATTSGFTTTAGADQLYVIHVNDAMLSGSDKFVKMTATEVVNSACDGAVIAFLANPRYAPNAGTVLA